MKKKQYGRIDLVKALDYAKRNFEIKGDTSKYGYRIEGKVPYENYMSNETWASFLNEMPQPYRKQFEDADGGETKVKKNGRAGLCPPKMASYGSSSRFIYQYSKDIKGISFEKQLPTHVGPKPANLDGFLQKDDIEKYVEAKCKEIYGNHKEIEVSEAYKKVYDFIYKNHSKFEYVDKKKTCKYRNHFRCTFKYKGQEIIHFDIKQLICHFLGITADILEHQKQGISICFIYLIFNPHTETLFTGEIERFKDEIFKLYDDTIKEIQRFGDMKWLFETIMEYQSEHLRLTKVDYSFDFKLVDQNNYIAELKC